ncbi:hypothetical protein Zm00014a_024906 [Zea mays]|uniref:Uncharacterized protein n=2 Tax=Zea mays TaxID=4577 RepID=A0A3L6DPD9_MAIZE|nr:hypothetical protein ZEAMMB73_Zm00001d031455 [Zea mays]PWZ09657.1 hypothetical protein Zm00014a_027494 [Zea mays]PWZ52470.1 hypothetical protein Zm00014a_024906 [Zea mays]
MATSAETTSELDASISTTSFSPDVTTNADLTLDPGVLTSASSSASASHQPSPAIETTCSLQNGWCYAGQQDPPDQQDHYSSWSVVPVSKILPAL